MVIRQIIITLVSCITNILPVSYNSHIYTYQKLFNTKLFNDQILINTIPISIGLYFIITNIKFRKIKLSKQKLLFTLKMIISTTIITLIYIIPKPIYSINKTGLFFLLTSIIIILSTNKKGNKKKNEISLTNSFIFPIFQILTFIPTISPLCSNLLASKFLRYNRKTSLYISTITLIPTYFISAIPYTKDIINNNLVPHISINIILSIFIINHIYKILKNIYNKNKLYKLSIYLIILSIYLLIWFR